MKDINENAPAPQQRNILKDYNCTRVLHIEQITPEGPKNNFKETNQEDINLSLNMILYEKEIEINIKGYKPNFKVPFIQYSKSYSFEELRNFNKFLALLSIDKIFDVFQKSLEQKFDNISQGEKELKIILMINIMDVMTEEILFTIPIIEMTNKDELESLKETIKFLDEERNILKSQFKSLSNDFNNIMKKIDESGISKMNKGKEIINIIEEKEKEIIKNIEDKDKTHQTKENDLHTKIEEKDKAHQTKEKELLNKIEEKEKEMNIKIEEKEKKLLGYIEKLNSQMKEVKEIEKYVREKLITEEKKEIKEKKKFNCEREIKFSSNPEKIFNLDISMYLIGEKIKFSIKEIQDNLKSNPLIYETSLQIDDFDKIKDYYKTQGGIEEIFNFLCELLKNKKDTIKLDDSKIIIKVRFPLGLKEEEILLSITKKQLSLKNTLSNIDKSLKELNLENKKQLNETKEEFKKNLLEKVYPVGSFYWSEKNINPGSIFGGVWSKIEGKFLFASDSNHSVGSTGGEERVTLSVSEIPSHCHGYTKFRYDSTQHPRNCETKIDGWHPYAETNNNYFENINTGSAGESRSHNNMPPYMTANCWKRIN